MRTKTNISTSVATTAINTTLKYGIPLLILVYGFSRMQTKFKKMFGIKPPTVKELAEDNAIGNNVPGVPLMTKYLDTDYRITAATYEVWSNMHPDNPDILKVIFDPTRKLKERFIAWIDVAVVDKQLLRELGENI